MTQTQKITSRERREATKKYLAEVGDPQRKQVVVGPLCTCRSFEFSHEIRAHRKLRADNDWRHYTEFPVRW